MKISELIDLSKKKQLWKSTVAAGKERTTNLDIVGIRIQQKQSTGETSRPGTVEALRNKDEL